MLRSTDKLLVPSAQVRDLLGGRIIVPSRRQEEIPVRSGLLAWFDASDLETITASAGAVSQWADKSGNGYHATQGTAGNKPTTGTRTQNGRNVIDFDGGDYLESSCPNDDISSSWFFVACYDTLTNYRPLIGSRGGTGGLAIRFNITTGQFQSERDGVSSFGATALLNPGAVAFGMGVSFSSGIISGLMSSSVSPGRAYGFSGSFTLTASRTLYIGVDAGTTLFWDGWIGEVIGYSRTVEQWEMYRIMEYLYRKWRFAWA